MGRKLAFNRQKALQTAMESFWSKGYEATSMRQLAESTGLRIGSVYNALGPKEKVFEESLQLYYDTMVSPRLHQMVTQTDPLAALDAALELVVEECRDGAPSKGCFLVNSLHEISGINESVTKLMNKIMRHKEKTYAACIAAAQKEGRIDATQSAEKLAQFVLAVQFSLRAMAKIGVPGLTIREIKNSMMQLLAMKAR